ncbi:probable carboxylesterase Os04g0669500 isoform X3 [Phalaenopsis equestris]|uniref:probable carboxylesterase Os04g0669500 isoform X3 n=1 Tax=Phalaenopsis equestris TaxID=78828 RepID=UPI0009E54158|nr:probable carboxylesterase Os04g0669500 isoform X3 [Phalaenopsis equestris]
MRVNATTALSTFLRPIALFSATTAISVLSFSLLQRRGLLFPANTEPPMAGSLIIWLHGLGDSGPANEPIRTFFTSSEFSNTKWSFPSASPSPVSCNYGAVMPSWFDIHEIPIGIASPKDEGGVLKAMKSIHSMIDKEIAAGISPKNIFICGFSQGGALTLASVLLYPKTLGGGAVFSGWVPFNNTIREKVSPEARKTPILWSHGMADPTVLFEAGQAGPPFLEDLGMQCEFKAYPNLGHSISTEELRSLVLWIKSRLEVQAFSQFKASRREDTN